MGSRVATTRPIDAEVGAEIVLRDLDPHTISRLRSALRYPNPEYLKARRGRHDIDPSIPTYLSACEEFSDGTVHVPRGAIYDIAPWLRAAGVKPHWRDRRASGHPINVTLLGLTMRNYQREGVDEFRKNLQGLIVLPCASGKTILGIGAIAAIGRTTLVVVPTRDLVNQWADDVQNLLGIMPAIYGTGKHELGPVTIATKDALHHNPNVDLSGFGVVVYDECHRVPARTNQELLRRIPARYRLGLTATPDREDGTSKLVRWSFGGVLLEKTVPEMVRGKWLVLPSLDSVFTDFFYKLPESPSYRDLDRMTKKMVKDGPRNRHIVSLVLAEPRESWLLLSPTSQSHCHELALLLAKKGLQVEVLTSAVKPRERERVLEDFRAGRVRIVAATSLADEGLNIRRLSRVVLTLPESSKKNTTQRLGRIMRPFGEKRPRVYDIVDHNIERLRDRWKSRKSVYRSMGLEINECPTLSLFDQS